MNFKSEFFQSKKKTYQNFMFKLEIKNESRFEIFDLEMRNESR